jgi:putative DNA primase/helicase
MIDVREYAKGKWSVLLPNLGVDGRFLNKRNGPCPSCGGKDRFRFTDFNGEGRYYCNQCGPGDGFDLVEKVTGKKFNEIRDYIMQNAGEVKTNTQPLDLEACRNEQAKVWGNGRNPMLDGPVDLYLRGRGLNLPDFKFKNIRQYDGGMIARVTDVNDSGVNIHRTFLIRNGENSVTRSEKKIMRGEIPKGSAIRLSDVQKVLGIAEGIETALSAWKLFGVPTWSLISTVGMVNWIPPEEVETVVVYADNDENYAGQASAYGVANKLVTRYGKKVEIRIPPRKGWDWNDTLLNQLGQS